jgi:hypothetical protein
LHAIDIQHRFGKAGAHERVTYVVHVCEVIDVVVDVRSGVRGVFIGFRPRAT